MEKIDFFSEATDFSLSNPNLISRWMEKVITQYDKALVNLNIIFCDDRYLHKINVKYLNHDTFTDIITFDYSEGEGQIEGELYISVERIQDNIKKLNVDFNEELCRVIIHGILHLLGWRDSSSVDKEIMRKEENKALNLLQEMKSRENLNN